jgi:hypothetical protein
MADEQTPALPSPTEVIALPPLKMILVHAKDEREDRAAHKPILKPAADAERVEPQTVKKLIAHLEKR